MAAKPKTYTINRLDGGLNLTQSTEINDNQFIVAKNMYYNKDKQIETRRGFTTFGDLIGNDPITSYFHFQRDDNLQSIAVCSSGTEMYSYDESGGTWSSIKTGLHEYETIPGITSNRTRWDYAVYKNVIYMCNGVDVYSKYDGTTYSEIGVSTVGPCTFTNATNVVNLTAHGLTAGDEVKFTTSGALPAEMNVGQYYYVINVNTNDFQISTSPSGDALEFTDDGTGTHTCSELEEPRIRYVSYLTDRLFGAGDDANPTTLYYTNAAPANGDNINQNVVVIGGDENGRINGLSELGNIILAGKSEKIYSVNVATPSAVPIDSQTGIFSDRCIANVGNSLVYFNDRGIDTLKQRNGVSGSSALESEELTSDLRQLIDKIEEKQYNASAGSYVKPLNNYYFAFDTNDDNIPDTVLVYNSLVSARTQYDLPNLYDFGRYITSDQEYQYLFASAINGQMYRFEYGFDDNGTDIEHELQTKKFDFESPGLLKTFDFVDIVGLKSIGTNIDVTILVDDEVATESIITDDYMDIDSVAKVLSANPISDSALTGSTNDAEIDLYRYLIRVPMYATGTTISINMKSTGGTWITEKMRISKNDQEIEVFNYNNIG